MKNQVLRRRVLLGSIPLLFALAIFALPRIARLQAVDDVTAKTENKAVKPPTGKHVNFDEPRQLDLGAQVAPSQPIALVTADFDSDGFADIVTADSAGALQLLKGIDPANFAIDPNTGEAARPEPFSASATGASLGISPDFLFAGDFNADGHSDILGAAKGATEVVVVLGDGFGHFSRPVNIGTGGSITLAEAGQIGRPDGQADLAVTFSNKNGNFLAVYEHPESAFKHAPEIIKLPSAATAITIGNMDEDFYSDIAVACGSTLVIIHERGQAYPWDIVKDSGISRPPAVVETRRMPFTIAAMTVGRFGEKRGTSLGILGDDGNIYELAIPKGSVSPATRVSSKLAAIMNAAPFEPADNAGHHLATISQEPKNAEEVDAYGNTIGDSKSRKGLDQMLAERAGNEPAPKFDLDEVNRRNAADAPRRAMMKQRTRDAFVTGISAKTSSIATWNVRPITTDGRFSAMVAANARLTRASVSDSPLEDLIVTSPISEQAAIVLQPRGAHTRLSVENITINGDAGILALLPMRLNLDGISDLITLRQGSAAPSVLMSAPSATFSVNTTDDDGDCNFGPSCSLRDAIRRANQIGGSSIIYFNISDTPSTISPLTPLPSLLQPITIQGSHQPDGTKRIEINGQMAGTSVDGLKIRTSNAFIYDLAITGFKSQTFNGSQVGGNGIAIESDSARPNNAHNTVLECYLGIDVTGTTAKGNMAAGILIFDSDENDVTNSVGSGNNTGIAIEGGNTNSFYNNILGLNAAGSAKVPNFQGMFLAGADNRVGGDFAGAPNTISGNGVLSNYAPCVGYGIAVPIFVDLTTLDLLSHDNSVVGNKLGTDPSGGIGLGNCWQGINAEPLTGTTIGSIAESGRNIISGNGLGGAWCVALGTANSTEGGFCSIMGNNVGTDITGTYSIYNDLHNVPPISGSNGAVMIASNISVSALGAPGGTTPGGACTGFCNLVSGNAGGFDIDAGIIVGGPGNIGVFNNYVGTKRNGAQVLENAGSGISLFSTTLADASPIYYVGGYTEFDGSLGNLVSGNNHTGIDVGGIGGQGGPGEYHVLGNLIGTDVFGDVALPNGSGVFVSTGFTNPVDIGDSNPLGRNVIAGNAFNGINIYTGFGVKIINNAIGANGSLAPLGNGGTGINVGGYYAASTTIGGTDSTTSNIISNNGKSGVKVNGITSKFNPIRGNVIHNNGQLGIDLNQSGYFPDGDGVTPNDDCDRDADDGPNYLQNFPVLFEPTSNPDGSFTVTGTLISRLHRHFTIDFYLNATADPSGHGEGQTYIGSASVTTNGNGFGTFSYTSPTGASPTNLSATATDDYGNTSEFSCIAGQTCADVPGFKTIDDYLASAPLSCPANLLVNLDSDESDDNANDNLCDINTNNSDPHECTLRAAMEMITHQGYTGTHCINFAIPGGGIHTINITQALPDVSVQMDLDATSQDPNSATPVIKLDGTGTSGLSGFKITGGNTTVKGFSIVNFTHGIEIVGPAGSNEITSNFVGINADGMTAPSTRQQTGILINDGSFLNRIGGARAGDGNVISNNVTGIAIIANSKTNLIINNRIGTSLDGSARLPNDYGVIVDASSGNNIGDSIERPNIIAGNNEDDVVLRNSSTFNSVAGNYIGVDTDNSHDVPTHGVGVRVISDSHDNVVGGNSADAANVIGDHTFRADSAGVYLAADSGLANRVISNRIGLRRLESGVVSIPNKYGILVYSTHQIIGKTASGADAGNVIAANQNAGIFVEGTSSNSVDVVIVANKIGTDNDQDFGNGGNGITLLGSVLDGTNIVRNLISGNQGWGVHIDGGQFIRLKGNKIGMNSSGNDQINNVLGGVYIHGPNNFIGGGNISDRNYIAGNGGNGVEIAAGSSNTTIQHNRIGTDEGGSNALENGGNGILSFGERTLIRDNLISGNHEAGIRLEHGGGDPEYQYHQISHNRIGTNSTGESAVANRTGILLINDAKANTISDNVVSGNPIDGISIRRGCNGNGILDNFIGTTFDGENALGNGDGVAIEGSFNTLRNNVISGNAGLGVRIAKTPVAGPADAEQNRLVHNRIGANGNGESAIPNAFAGVVLTGGAHQNWIGGIAPNDGNTISGNGSAGNGYGVLIITATDPEEYTLESPNENNVLANIIGGNSDADGALGNHGPGISVRNSPGNVIGNNACSLCGNVVVSNEGSGVEIIGVDSVANSVSYNYIGANRSANRMGNSGNGLLVNGAPSTLVAYNNIGGNTMNGVSVVNVLTARPTRSGDRPVGNTPLQIVGNKIGVIKPPVGEFQKVANQADGLILEMVSGIKVGSLDYYTLDDKNIIAGNNAAGIRLRGQQTTGNTIVNTMVGTVPGGGGGFGNLKGVIIENAPDNVFGDINNTAAELRNVISNNLSDGIVIDGLNALTNQVVNSVIKLNGAAGVLLDNAASQNRVGGPQVNAGNQINNNAGPGVRLTPAAGAGNQVDPNEIYDNGGLGIDIGALGHTPNDIGDADTGPNNLQNYPQINLWQIDVNGDLLINFKVDSLAANSNYGANGIYVEFFEADLSGEGERFIGSNYWTLTDLANAGKVVNLGNAAALGIAQGDLITASATDADGNTSEFFPPFAPSAAGVTVGGRIVEPNGNPIGNAMLTLTDTAGHVRRARSSAFGWYRFDDVEVGQTYVLAVSHKRFTFINPTRVLSLTDELTDVNFTSDP